MKRLVALVALLAMTSATAFAQTSTQMSPAAAALAPSAVIAGASNYDKQDVTVTGTIKNVQTKTGQRGPMTTYQLCDTQCVNVVQFGTPTLTAGQSQTITGRFRSSVKHGDMQMQNVIMIAPPGGWHHPH
jgi:hypothetical protein